MIRQENIDTRWIVLISEDKGEAKVIPRNLMTDNPETDWRNAFTLTELIAFVRWAAVQE